MASPCEVLVDGAQTTAEIREITEVAAAEAWRVEDLWSRYRTDNVVHRINTAQGEPVGVDEETARFLDYAAHLHDWSGGLFDVTSGVLRRVWRFDGSDRVPSPEAIAALMPLVGWRRVDWCSPVLQMPAGMEIDFGGIGKEYAVDRALALILGRWPQRAVLVNFGGDLAASAPRASGEPWRVGLEAPGHTDAGAMALYRGAIASSGDAHRFLLRDGVRYSHLLDPRSGQAVIGAPRTVTVRAASCTEAGVLASLALLHGADAARFLEESGADAQIHW